MSAPIHGTPNRVFFNRPDGQTFVSPPPRAHVHGNARDPGEASIHFRSQDGRGSFFTNIQISQQHPSTFSNPHSYDGYTVNSQRLAYLNKEIKSLKNTKTFCTSITTLGLGTLGTGAGVSLLLPPLGWALMGVGAGLAIGGAIATWRTRSKIKKLSQEKDQLSNGF